MHLWTGRSIYNLQSVIYQIASFSESASFICSSINKFETELYEAAVLIKPDIYILILYTWKEVQTSVEAFYIKESHGPVPHLCA